jgi:hypothetical protein
MPHPHIIAMLGHPTAGKDAVGEILRDDHGFARLAFADHLREIAYDRGWSGVKDEEGRAFLERVSDAVKRERGEKYFLLYVLHQMESPEYRDRAITITDARFHIEINSLTCRGAKLWRVSRPGAKQTSMHRSQLEWQAHRADALIPNDGTLDALRHVVAHHLRAMRGERRAV